MGLAFKKIFYELQNEKKVFVKIILFDVKIKERIKLKKNYCGLKLLFI